MALQFGASGRAVQLLQWRLGVLDSAIFDAPTRGALVAWQQARGLTADGVYGPITNAAMTGRTPTAIRDAAEAASLDAAAMTAIVNVETAGSGFLADGRPTLLLERHYVYRLASSAQRQALPASVCYPTRGGYQGGAAEWSRFEQVAKLDLNIAIQSCSWGLGQIMGANFSALGYSRPNDFFRDAAQDEAKQLAQMAQFLRSVSGMDRAMRSRDWTTVARLYNGPGYAANRYDEKLAAAFSTV